MSTVISQMTGVSHASDAIARFIDPDKPEFDQLLSDLKLLRIDAPAVNIQQLDDLESELNDGDGTGCTVVLAHHAFLPQHRPRTQINSEPVNAGDIRDRLISAKGGTVYLHGHLHTDPVEVLVHTQIDSAVISIGAPELHEGFNLVDLVFDESRRFLGVELYEYRRADLRITCAGPRKIHAVGPHTFVTDPRVRFLMRMAEPGRVTYTSRLSESGSE